MPKRRASSLARARSLIAIRNDPALPALVRSLSPGALAQLCSRIGIHDATEIMAAAPAAQLVRALDVALWKNPRPGLSDVFDRSELMAWLAAWLEVGEAFTAETMESIPDEDLVLYLSHVLTVSTGDMWGFERSTEIEDLDRIYAPSYHESAYGPFVVTAILSEDWETIRAALDALWLRQPERMLHLFSQLAASESMLAPQESRESSNADFASLRESARERHGHVTAAGARAFLAFAERVSLDELVELREFDLETRRHLSVIESFPGESSAGTPEEEPDPRLAHTDHAAPAKPEALQHDACIDSSALDTIRARLQEEGLLDAPPQQRLLTSSRAGRRLPLVEALAQLSGSDPAALDARARELAYLANVLLAGVALNDRAMSAADARQAALALCNLGLETLQARQEDPCLGNGEPGLVRLFLIGRSVLQDIPDRLVRAFACALERLQAASSGPAHEWLVAEAQAAFVDLRDAVTRHDLAAARDAMTVMGFFFDGRSCHRALALLDEIPRLARTAGGETALTWIESLRDLSTLSRLLDGIQIKGHGRV
jgi:hypothetical protein